MVLLEGAAASAAATTGLFGYNRQNFLYDRKMRQKQEYRVLTFRNHQAELWREDVRDLVGLTLRKMENYNVVAALQLGFCLDLFAAGRLEPGTPEWLLFLYMLALVASFGYLFLAVWFSLRASVAAQAGSTRLLTQFVRLVIPSWNQIEAMRTYGRSAEGLAPQKLLRVPFSERLKAFWRGSPKEEEGQPDLESCRGEENDDGAADPWALERKGESIYELQARPTRDLRHVDITRRAAVHWQGYDAFTRVSMTFGTCHLLYAIMYYCLGYILVEDAEVLGAYFVAAMMAGAIAMLLSLDLSLTGREFVKTQGLVYCGPFMSCIAAYFWCRDVDPNDWGKRVSMLVLPFAYLSHFLVLRQLLAFVNISELSNGMQMPVRWRAVLYLDVFGWLPKPGDPTQPGSRDENLREVELAMGSELRPLFPERHAEEGAERDPEDLVLSEGERPNWPSLHSNLISESPPWRRGDSRGSDASAESLATSSQRPQEDADEKERKIKGIGTPAAIPWAKQSDFDHETYLPFDLDPENPSDSHEDQREAANMPVVLFKDLTKVFLGLYVFATLWSVWVLLGLPDFKVTPLPLLTLREYGGVNGTGRINDEMAFGVNEQGGNEYLFRGGGTRPGLSPSRGFSNMRLSGLTLQRGQQLELQWPYSARRSQPDKLSCDADGSHFSLLDDFGAFVAHWNSSSSQQVRFQRLEPCWPNLGSRLQDLALVCPPGPGLSQCRAHALYKEGSKTMLASCELGARGPLSPKEVREEWLEEEGDERIMNLAVDHDSFGSEAEHEATLLTSQARVVRLRARRGDASQLVPAWASRTARETPSQGEEGVLRLLPDGRVAALHRQRSSKGGHILISQPGKDRLKGWSLPKEIPWSSFCITRSHIYALARHGHAKASSPTLWRFPLTES